jgi:hypothetical protein
MRNSFTGILCLLLANAAGAQELPEDLKHVPGNAIGFIHLRTAELWKTPTFKIYRDLLPNAGADAIKLLEERISPPLSSIDRVTIVYLAPARLAAGADERGFRTGDMRIAVIVHSKEKLKKEVLLANLEKVVAPNKAAYYRTPKHDAVQILSDHTFLTGQGNAPELMADGGPPAETFRQSLVAAASSKSVIIGAVNTNLIPIDALRDAPPFVQPFLRARTAVASLDANATAEISLDFADPDHAAEARKNLAGLREMGLAFIAKTKVDMRKKLDDADRTVPLFDVEAVAEIAGPVFAMAAIHRAEAILKDIPIQQDNNRISVALRLPEELNSYGAGMPILVGLLVPAVQKVRESATSLQDANNLKQLALAMHEHHDNYKKFPPPAICDKAGKPLLSWRVAILPFIEENELYKQFKLDEPWDSDHNKKLIARMPPPFRLMSAQPEGSTDTHFRVFVGPNGAPSALFRNPMTGTSIRAITDGTSRTIMIAAADDAVPWTKPDELKYDPQQPLPKLKLLRRGYLVGLCDGSVWRVPETVTERQLRAAITRDGGEADRLPEVD